MTLTSPHSSYAAERCCGHLIPRARWCDRSREFGLLAFWGRTVAASATLLRTIACWAIRPVQAAEPHKLCLSLVVDECDPLRISVGLAKWIRRRNGHRWWAPNRQAESLVLFFSLGIGGVPQPIPLS